MGLQAKPKIPEKYQHAVDERYHREKHKRRIAKFKREFVNQWLAGDQFE
jgi:hypothetical protein